MSGFWGSLHRLNFCQLAGLESLEPCFTIEFQIPHIATPLAVDSFEDLSIGEVAIEGKITWNLFPYQPIYQFLEQIRMALKLCPVSGVGVNKILSFVYQLHQMIPALMRIVMN